MNKTSVIYREIAERLLRNRRERFVGRELAKSTGASADTVSAAIAPLKRIGAVSGYRRHFEVTDFKKLLLFQAVNRRMYKDIIYTTYIKGLTAGQIEELMPDDIAYTDYSGYVKLFGNDAAGYSEVYVYAAEPGLEEIKKRAEKNSFSATSDYSNLIVLKPDRLLGERIKRHKLERSSVSLPQLYADLWNTNTWYAHDFLDKLEKRIDDTYAKAILE